MEQQKINFFSIIPFSFVPPKYNKLIKESAGKIFGAILICFIILGVITGIRVNNTLNEATDEIRANCPNFRIVGGEFEIDQPYSFDADSVFVNIDDSIEEVTQDDIQALIGKGTYQSIIIIGKYGFGMYSNGQIQVHEYSEFNNINNISKDILVDRVMPLIKTIAVLAVILFAFIQVGLYYFVALIMQLFTMLLAKIFGKELNDAERFRMTVLAKLPIHILVYVINNFTHINWVINMCLQIVYIAVVVYFYKKESAELVEDTTQYIEENNQY